MGLLVGVKKIAANKHIKTCFSKPNFFQPVGQNWLQFLLNKNLVVCLILNIYFGL